MRFFRAVEGEGRWFTPFPDHFPTFKIEIQRLSNDQIVALADKWRTSRPNATRADQYAFWKESCERSVKAWEGEADIFATLFPDVKDTSCAKAKVALLRADVIECERDLPDGTTRTVRESLWQHLDHWTSDQEEVELKN